MRDRDDYRLEMLYGSVIGESYTISVPFDEQPAPENLSDMADAIQTKFFFPFMKKNFSPEEIKNFQKQGMASHALTPDGDDYFEIKGTINFYTRGIPEHFIEKYISGIKYYIEECGGELLDQPIEQISGKIDSKVWRFPCKIVNLRDETTHPKEINWNNHKTGIILCDVLNYRRDEIQEYQPLNVRDLLIKIETIEDNDYVIGKAETQTKQDGNFISFGVDKHTIKHCLDQLKVLCNWCIENHHSELHLS